MSAIVLWSPKAASKNPHKLRIISGTNIVVILFNINWPMSKWGNIGVDWTLSVAQDFGIWVGCISMHLTCLETGFFINHTVSTTAQLMCFEDDTNTSKRSMRQHECLVVFLFLPIEHRESLNQCFTHQLESGKEITLQEMFCWSRMKEKENNATPVIFHLPATCQHV